jgi:hypothetical protein
MGQVVPSYTTLPAYTIMANNDSNNIGDESQNNEECDEIEENPPADDESVSSSDFDKFQIGFLHNVLVRSRNQANIPSDFFHESNHSVLKAKMIILISISKERKTSYCHTNVVVLSHQHSCNGFKMILVALFLLFGIYSLT